MRSKERFEIYGPHPLMDDNITRDDINAIVHYLTQPGGIPRLTNGPKVKEFEEAWSNWLGCKYSVFVNSGSSANHLTMMALKYIYETNRYSRPGLGEIIVPPLTWVSDISSVIYSGFKPIFCDINLNNLSFDLDMLESLINKNTRGIFLTHVLGINGITDRLLDIVKKHDIMFIEDVCESHGTTFKDQKVGTFGHASNFSFYFAHHMSTIEGGMVCTNDEAFYNICRALRSHGMSREMTSDYRDIVERDNPDLNPDFIFIAPSHNFRNTELNAIIGLNQLKRLDHNNRTRQHNFEFFMDRLNSDKFITDIEMEGQCNYALIVILKEPDIYLRDKIEKELDDLEVEYRRGLSGGGNQMRQPYFEDHDFDMKQFPNIEHVHNFGWYIGNSPTLNLAKVVGLVEVLNEVTEYEFA